jgi:hypothetical protein
VDGRRALVDSAKGALYFLALGPPVGALALWAIMSLGLVTVMGPSNLAESPSSAGMSLAGFGLMALVMMLYSWVLGSVPAVITGALIGPWRWRFHQWRWCLLAGVVGAAAAVGFFQLWAPLGGENGGAWPALYPVVPGFPAGVLVAKVFALRAPYPPPKMPPLPRPAGIGDSP